MATRPLHCWSFIRRLTCFNNKNSALARGCFIIPDSCLVAWQRLGVTGSFGLEGTLKIVESNHDPAPALNKFFSNNLGEFDLNFVQGTVR